MQNIEKLPSLKIKPGMKEAAAHNIPLVRISYWKRDNITLDMLLGDQYLVKGDT